MKAAFKCKQTTMPNRHKSILEKERKSGFRIPEEIKERKGLENQNVFSHF
jgi:hypothetical protein